MITTTLNARTNVLPDASETDLLRDQVVQVQHDRGAELWGLARHLGLSPDEADDAVQETLTRLWSSLRDGTEIERADAWAFRSLYRLAMDRHRWHRRIRLLTERIGRQPGWRSSVDHAERLAIWDAVEDLPERQRLAVYLRYRADLPYEEIGEILGIAPPSVRSHVSRALDALRVELGEEASR